MKEVAIHVKEEAVDWALAQHRGGHHVCIPAMQWVHINPLTEDHGVLLPSHFECQRLHDN